MNYEDLLSAYRSIWNNRLLEKGGRSAEEVLRDAIQRELLDENSHPRIRKSKEEKFSSAMKRVRESNLADGQKNDLMSIHMEVMDDIIRR